MQKEEYLLFIKLSQDHLISGFLILIVIASAGDLAADLSQGASTSHLVQETVLLLLALAGLGWLLLDNLRKKQLIRNLHAELEEIQKIPQQAPKEVLEAKSKLSELISTQFSAWALTNSEKEVGLLLLKGFSLKEISALRGTAEKTIRQQASSIYQKSGVSGRHAFAAWFIEDFL